MSAISPVHCVRNQPGRTPLSTLITAKIFLSDAKAVNTTLYRRPRHGHAEAERKYGEAAPMAERYVALAFHLPGSRCSSAGRKKDADDLLHTSPAPHTCVHAVVFCFTARKVPWHDRRAMLRGHRELRQAPFPDGTCKGPALNKSTVLRTATFFRIPVVRVRRRDQTRNACGEDETCPGTRQIGSCNFRRN